MQSIEKSTFWMHLLLGVVILTVQNNLTRNPRESPETIDPANVSLAGTGGWGMAAKNPNSIIYLCFTNLETRGKGSLRRCQGYME